ncbi:hypothetical protein PWT90_03142 [Aphanocladium album]|nr:hypothetical protein PWT90_03142 [Aphanocladium album]
MGCRQHCDTDEERLPEGFTRIGYDADSGVYSYQDGDGSYWDGAAGRRYGPLKRREENSELATYPEDEASNKSDATAEADDSSTQAGGAAEETPSVGKDRDETRRGIYARLTRYCRHAHVPSTRNLTSENASTLSCSEVLKTDHPEQTMELRRATTFDDILGRDAADKERIKNE